MVSLDLIRPAGYIDDARKGNPIIGRLMLCSDDVSISSRTICHTLEPPLRGSGSYIRSGIYGLCVTYSPKFRTKLPLLTGVVGRSGIRIHAGNTSKDTRGCILVGISDGTERLKDSRACLSQVISLINRYRISKISIVETISDFDGDLPF